MNPGSWKQVEELYHAALELSPATRSAMLSKADPEVRREVEALLASDGSLPSINLPWIDAPPEPTRTLAAAGQQLGPYRLLAQIGEGGMGTVYRATDTRLGRAVAIKVSQERFSERFEREARTISALNHPYICTLYDVGPNYLVMELIEGETLAQRLRKGPLSMELTLRYGIQIAQALVEAHSRDVVHRDLKPGNVMIARNGVKVLDFGLAKSAQDADLTAPLALMGTPAYMAPEQREGAKCDARTDIFALGLILYEMATGKRALVTEDQPAPLDGLPPQFARVVARAFDRDPAQRFQSASDLAFSLESAAPAEAKVSPRATRRWPVLLAGALAIAVLVLLGERNWRRPPPPELIRLQIPFPDKTTVEFFAISPDGRSLAFSAVGPDNVSLVSIRALNSFEARPVPGTEGVELGTVFWSPDGRFIGFEAGKKLKKIDLTGGPAQTICDVPGQVAGSWNRDGVIVFGPVKGLMMRVSAAGGIPQPITVLQPSRKETQHTSPTFLPDGKHFVYFRGSTAPEFRGAFLGSLDVKPEQQSTKPLAATVARPGYAASADAGIGYVLFLREGILMAQTLDARRLEVTGEAVPIAASVVNKGNVGLFSASANGVLVYVSSGEFGAQLNWFDRQGKNLGAIGSPMVGIELRISPDATQAALVQIDASTQSPPRIALMDLTRGTLTPFAFESTQYRRPTWSPDGRRIAFAANRGGAWGIYQKAVSGQGTEELLAQTDAIPLLSCWSNDGRFLLYNMQSPATKADLWVLPVGGDRKPVPFLRTEFNERDGYVSPDGHWIGYTSDSSGAPAVYVQPFDFSSVTASRSTGSANPGGKWLVSQGPGFMAQWRADGKELVYATPDGELMSVETTTAPVFKAGPPALLFKMSNRNSSLADGFPDLKRFLFPTNGIQNSRTEFKVVLNWPAGLKK